MRTKNLLRNTMQSSVLVIVLTLSLLLWPIRMLNKGLKMVDKWTLSHYR